MEALQYSWWVLTLLIAANGWTDLSAFIVAGTVIWVHKRTSFCGLTCKTDLVLGTNMPMSQ